MARNATAESSRGTPRPAPGPSSAQKDPSRSSRKRHASSPDPIAPSPVRNRKRPRKHGDDVSVEINHAQNGNTKPAEAAAPVAENNAEEVTLDQQLEAWQDFAAEHYEMVEQLPLELHRNFRLLRELDDECVAQTSKLQEQIRAYINARMELVKRYAAVAGAIQGAEASGTMAVDDPGVAPPEANAELEEAGLGNQPENGIGQDTAGQEMEADAPPELGPESAAEDVGAEAVIAPAPPEIATASADEVEHSSRPVTETETESRLAPATAPSPPPMPVLPYDMGELIPDGEGGLVVASSNAAGAYTSDAPVSRQDESAVTKGDDAVNTATENVVTTNTEAPVAESAAEEAATEEAPARAQGSPPAERSTPAPEASASASDLASTELPARFLPEIGRLAREIVRNCEEKVALAVGAYNSIDRHIRALDSALNAQETNLILGLRPDTLPSANVDQTLGLAGDDSAIIAEVEGEEGDMVLGLGGGARNARKKKGKKGKNRAETEEVLEPQIVAEVPRDPEMENVDPNEPTYCYCNKVSYGTMIGCDNDDCPLEWFHLPCTGLQVEPQGSWMCNICKPKIGLGMGGAGSVQPGGVEKKAGKKKRRG